MDFMLHARNPLPKLMEVYFFVEIHFEIRSGLIVRAPQIARSVLSDTLSAFLCLEGCRASALLPRAKPNTSPLSM